MPTVTTPSTSPETTGAPLRLPPLRLERLRFHCEAQTPIRLPSYSGSAWRGLLGHSLRASVCVTRAPHCDGCLLIQQCAYSTFFESPAPPDANSKRYSALPHPFVLEPPPPGQRSVSPGDPLDLGLTLIGPAGDLLPYLIHALRRAGERGLGREQGRFQLVEVAQETAPGSGDWQRVHASASGVLQTFRSRPPSPGGCPESVQLQLITPLRLKQRGHFVRAEQLDARALLAPLGARVTLLTDLYGTPANPPRGLPRNVLHAAIDQMRLEPADLRWVDWTRYSSRQRTEMQLGGLLGTLQLSGPGLGTLWPLIHLGQWLHLGKGTSFGLGRYRLVANAPSTL